MPVPSVHEATIQAYFDGIRSHDCGAIVRLFTPDARVHHPHYGVVAAPAFYEKLLDDVSHDEINLKNLFASLSSTDSVAAYFEDIWTTRDGTSHHSIMVLVFYFNSHGAIERLDVVFAPDGFPSRSAT